MTPRGRTPALAAAVTVVVIIAVVIWSTWADIRFWMDFEKLGPNEQGYAEYRHRDSGIVFVSLPGGTFLMGSPEDEDGRLEDEGSVHEVTLSPFTIAKYEVSQAQWVRVMGDGSNSSRFKGENHPVKQVSWDDLHDQDGFLNRTRFVLPSEAQWEYACRAGTLHERQHDRS